MTRTDTERLDFLERVGGYVSHEPIYDPNGNNERPCPWRFETADESIEEWADSAREAIDQAMCAEESRGRS